MISLFIKKYLKKKKFFFNYFKDNVFIIQNY